MSAQNIIEEALKDEEGFIGVTREWMQQIAQYCTVKYLGNVTQHQADEILKLCCQKLKGFCYVDYIEESLTMIKNIIHNRYFYEELKFECISRKTNKYPGDESAWLRNKDDRYGVYPTLMVKILKVLEIDVNFDKISHETAVIEIIDLSNPYFQKKILKDLLSLNFVKKLPESSQQQLVAEIFDLVETYKKE